ncbi:MULTISPECIES: hypothetical protein [Olivibacter]|uniref:ParB-related ThiF-related cassette protein E domain-containing protein n=1 Tax=Olivibacter oleidegradans TaxID=760123 RepID=A0ABV6HKM1_9SPHI|nr:hypothetical protein [Olivibacter jilunii]
METNFFKNLADIGVQGNMVLMVRQLENSELLVLLHLTGNNVKDAVVKTIQPLKLSGTAEELDSRFFETVTAPVKKVSGFLAEVEAQEKSLAEARKKWDGQKKKAKPTAQAEETEKNEEKEKAFSEAMQRVTELERAMDYSAAIGELPDAAEYPDKRQEIATKRKELEQKEKLGATLF